MALAGRSTGVKSSFINKMIQRKALARTSSKPGKTRILNFYKINEQFHFVDVPGYGDAKVSKTEREKWGIMMEEYFSQRGQLQAVLLITDMRHAPTKEDVMMYDCLKAIESSVIVVATKVDKIPKNKKDTYLKRTRTTLDIEATDDLIAFSAETGEGKDKAWKLIEAYL